MPPILPALSHPEPTPILAAFRTELLRGSSWKVAHDDATNADAMTACSKGDRLLDGLVKPNKAAG